MPRLRNLPFETQIIERYRRRETSVEEALVEMYLAGVSVRRVEDITEALWGTRVSPSTVSELNQKIYAQIEAWRNRPIEGQHAYVYLDGIWLKAIHAQEDRQAARDKARPWWRSWTRCGWRSGWRGAGGVERRSRTWPSRASTGRVFAPTQRAGTDHAALIRRRTRVVGNFPDGESAVMLVAARLRHIASTKWGTRRYLDMDRLREPDEGELTAAG